MNSVLVIKPYRCFGTWVFDDERVGLYREPFVNGIPEMIDELVVDVENADNGFRLTFSSSDFPNSQKHLSRMHEDLGGCWYKDEKDNEGWLCPALFKYFDSPPEAIYARADSL